MSNQAQKTIQAQKTPRPPVVAVMGHIDHGKSTLLDYIRKTNMVEKEAGGITQHLGAYVVPVPTLPSVKPGLVTDATGAKATSAPGRCSITFLDTPGHEAFKGIRERGATVADVAILVVSAEEGVKPQTLEALSFIKKTNTPYIVALTKIDKPQADVERTKQSLAEKEIYLEGYGGDIPYAAISAKTGAGIDELLDLVLLVAELHEIGKQAGTSVKAFVIEAGRDERKGVFATLIVKEGTLKQGVFLVVDDAFASTRRLENFLRESIEAAPAGTPVSVVGWTSIPRVGAQVALAASKREAESLVEAYLDSKRHPTAKRPAVASGEVAVLPLIIKADTAGSLEAVEQEVQKLRTDAVDIRVISRGIGSVGEGDLKLAQGAGEPVIVGFNVGFDAPAKSIIERSTVTVATFDIIYKLIEWVHGLVKARTPKVSVVTVKGNARVLKIFTTEKDRQVVGGKVQDGELSVGDEFKILRRDAEIGSGRIRELQRFKEKTSSIPKDSEFGAYVSSSVELMPSDRIEAITTVEQ